MSGPGSRWRALPLWARDGLLALALTVAGQVELVLLGDEVAGSRPLQHVAFAVMTGSLLLRRLRPVAAAGTVAAGLAFQTLLGDAPAVAGFAALLIATYSVAQYAERRIDALLGLLAILTAIEVYPFVVDDVSIGDEIGNVAIPIIVWVFARLARERLDRAVQAERDALAAHDQLREEELARTAALAAERRRIARDMHDVVGHGVTLMLLHADAAQASLRGREPAAVQALDVVLTAGRTALVDLQRMLRVLRDDATGEPGDAQPGTLAAVEGLVDAAASAGRDVLLSVDGQVRPLPAAVEATAYRVVQESVTNALKHAPAARIRVRLSYTERALQVDVADDGRVEPGGPKGAGFGLVGIRERVALFDGRVSAGPREDGPGWRVRAQLPVPSPEAASV
ncbi:sensor histidine kinase [Blastococcus haudaquaticus]|uniref:histidine kinase n=1 Tax=Blastococcus haudaquaticus TaxID=1938745 RepID=A0A286H1D6_9ACTN|nr:sensor histidine kinase [Blastococcus haudaquaticus]SOE01575.1 Signal transduction histidine kinase [Blastococcus haudaquaticus]